MRRIPINQTVAGFSVLGLWMGLSVGLSWIVWRFFPNHQHLYAIFIFIFFYIATGIGLHRLLMVLVPLKEGKVAAGSPQEFSYHVFYLPFYFFLFYKLLITRFVPIPLTRCFYRLLGARIGENTYPGYCLIFDPLFVTVGKNVTMGYQSSLIPHALEGGDKISFRSIQINDDAVIGVNVVIFGGVTVGEGAVIAAGAVVPKNTLIPPGELWGGVPAKKIKTIGNKSPA
jgi:acetyltransferase-like isoleucine patch superfamily enzyme